MHSIYMKSYYHVLGVCSKILFNMDETSEMKKKKMVEELNIVNKEIIHVISVNIQDPDKHFIITNDLNMKGSDIPVISVNMLPPIPQILKSTRNLNMKGSDILVISVIMLQQDRLI